jgi:RimJ/RimL family protein N-acetyltransferase
VGDDLTGRAARLWEELAGGRFPGPGAVRVVENPESRICPPGWAGIVRLGGAVLATAPTAAQAALLRRTTDPAALPVLDQLGPAQLAYAGDPPPAADPVEWAGEAELSELMSAATPDEVDESGVAGLPRAAVVRTDGRVVAAAGWAPWPARTAHLCVLTAADARGRGLATRTAAAATADALAAGMLPQWRARVEASQRVAAKLGYRVLGTQLSLHLKA